MNKNLNHLTLLLCAACSAPSVLEIPQPPDAPGHWSQYSTVRFENSSCPSLAGEYLEPPVVFHSKLGDQKDSLSEINKGSYYGHIPLHLADSRELKKDEVQIDSNTLHIRQPDADNLYFVYVTHKSSIVEDHLNADEGDFKCKSGYLEFPRFRSYGMIEGMSVNSQIRNVILRDNEGGLIIQQTVGPYRGDPSASVDKFSYKFLRFSAVEEK